MFMNEDVPLTLERAADEPEGTPALAVGFTLHPKKDDGETERKGYPVFSEKEYICIRIPGDETYMHFQPAKQKDRDRFPKAYAAFKNRNVEPEKGFPIEQWPQLTRGEAMTLKSMAINTVEALAEVHDGNITKLGHLGREWRAKAKAFLAQAKDTAEAQRLADENERKDMEMAELRRQIADLASRLQDEPKRGPGRPRKEVEAA